MHGLRIEQLDASQAKLGKLDLPVTFALGVAKHNCKRHGESVQALFLEPESC